MADPLPLLKRLLNEIVGPIPHTVQELGVVAEENLPCSDPRGEQHSAGSRPQCNQNEIPA